MEFYRKKLKYNKNSSDENIMDKIDEIENKIEDMQPGIHRSAGDDSTLQRNISAIKINIKNLQRLQETANPQQKEKIKTVIKKLNEILTQCNNASVRKSSEIFEKNDLVKVPQNKVNLNEVEEKLKSMRQKRLDRLSVFDIGPSSISEERGKRNIESNEIEDAIKSIQHTDTEKKTSFKSITEENLIQNKANSEEEREKKIFNVINTPNVNRYRRNDPAEKNKNKYSPKKFINKLTCTTTNSIYSSNEDLLQDTGEKTFPKSQNLQLEITLHLEKDTNTNGNSELQVQNKSLHSGLDNSNPLLSPMGKQRKAIYLYDNECDFLANEKPASLPFVLNFQKDKPPDSSLNKPREVNSTLYHIYENKDIIAQNDTDKKRPVLTTFQKNINKVQIAEKGNAITQKHISRLYENTIPKNTSNTINEVYENKNIISKNTHGDDKQKYANNQLSDKSKDHYKTEIIKSSEEASNLTIFEKSNIQGFVSKAEVQLKEETTYENRDIIHSKRASEKIHPILKTFRQRNQHKNDIIKLDNGKETASHLFEDVEKCHNNIIEEPLLTDPESGVKENKQKLSDVETNEEILQLPDYKTEKETIDKLIITTKMACPRKSGENNHNILRSPLPLPKKNNFVEKVLKKFQRNWDNLNEIIENDSDVDCDEIEDFKKTLEEADSLLDQYKANIKTLYLRINVNEYNEQLNEIKRQLEFVENTIIHFRGLKRDTSYKEITSKLANYVLEINNIKCNKADIINEKKQLLNVIEKYGQLLDNKVARNETVLLEILEVQVKRIGTNLLNITSV